MNRFEEWLNSVKTTDFNDETDLAEAAWNEAINGFKPNVVFGVLTNGEMFVQIGENQYTPPNSFYRLVSMESAKIAHEAIATELENKTLKESIKKQTEVIEISLEYLRNTDGM